MRFLAIFSCVAAAFAQSGGTITGTISDVDGMAVSNAPVQFANKSTGQVLKATSSQTGVYTLAQVPPGTYDLSIAALGFNAYSRQNVTVGTAQTMHLDIRLVEYQFGTLG